MFSELVHTRYHPLSSQKVFATVAYMLLFFVAHSSYTMKVLFVGFGFFLKHAKAQEEK